MAERDWKRDFSPSDRSPCVNVNWEAVRASLPSLLEINDTSSLRSSIDSLESDYRRWIEQPTDQTWRPSLLEYKEIHARFSKAPKQSYVDNTWVLSLRDYLLGSSDRMPLYYANLQAYLLSGPITTVVSNWSLMFSSLPEELLCKFNVLTKALRSEDMQSFMSEGEQLWMLKREALRVLWYFATPAGLDLLKKTPTYIKTTLSLQVKVAAILENTHLCGSLYKVNARSRIWKLACDFFIDAALWIRANKRQPLALYGIDDKGARLRVSMADACQAWFRATGEKTSVPKEAVKWGAYVDLLSRASNACCYGSYGRQAFNLIDPFTQVVLANSTPSKEFELFLRQHSPINTMLVISTETK